MTAPAPSSGPAPAPPARNSLYILAARLLETAASLGVAAIITRNLGVTAYGRYALIVSFVMLFGQFISFGLEHIIIREVARAPQGLRRFLGAGMALELILGAAVIPISLGLSFLLDMPAGDRAGIVVFGVAFFLRAAYEVVFRSAFIAAGAARYETALTFFFQVFRLGFVAAVAWAGGGVVAFLGAVLAAEAINAAAAYAVLRRRFAAVAPMFDKGAILFLVANAWPIAIMGILNNVFFQQDTILIKSLTGDYHAVGLFAAAYRLVIFFIFLMIPTMWPLLPEFSRLAHGGGAASGDLVAGVRRAQRAVLFLVLPATVLVAVFAPQFIRYIFGAPYLAAAPALMLLAISMTARPLGYLADATMIAAGRQWYLAAIAGGAVAVNFIIDLLLIPRMGFMGAAWGTAIADTFGVMLSITVTSILLGKPLVSAGCLRPLALALAIGVLAWAAMHWAGLEWYIVGPAAVVAFAAGTLALLGADDRRALWVAINPARL